ncbi:MAG: acetate kinase [Candidatus Omnitrophota bacterium]
MNPIRDFKYIAGKAFLTEIQISNGVKILVINCGSSSIKYKLYNFPASTLIVKGLIERVGEKKSGIKDHTQGIKVLIADILKKKAVESLEEISAIGHRVVHGAEVFRQPRLIDNKVIKNIKKCSGLAPLHNPANLAGIISCKKFFSKIPQVAVFDTAFHQSIPEHAYRYALQNKYYHKYKIRKYGFHGTSHQFVAQTAAKQLAKPLNKLKLITCHLGNGCSITAINKGQSVDTSMGFTPLEGLIMGTRCGDIDPAVILYIMKKENLSISAASDILNKKSGLLGVSGISNDFRAIKEGAKKGKSLAKLAYDMFIYRIKKYIGAYYFVLAGVDAICFTGGIGENNLDVLNSIKKDISTIIPKKVKVLTIPTDEELMIANLTYELITAKYEYKGLK